MRESTFNITVTEYEDKISIDFQRKVTCWEHYFLATTFITKRLEKELWSGKKILEEENADGN